MAFNIANPWPLAKMQNLVTAMAKILWRKFTTEIMNASFFIIAFWYCHIFCINTSIPIISELTVVGFQFRFYISFGIKLYKKNILPPPPTKKPTTTKQYTWLLKNRPWRLFNLEHIHMQYFYQRSTFFRFFSCCLY